jgi:predicted phage terminase large subunit-like protein
VTVFDMPRELVPEGVWEEMEADKRDDYDAYLNTWEGFPLKAKDGGIFRPEKINIIPAAPAGLRLTRGWDFASSAVLKGKNPDWSVGFKLGRNPDTERYCIVDVLRFRGRPDEVEQQLITTTKNDGLDVQQDIPTDPGSAGVFAVTNFVKKLSGYRVVTSLETGSKILRGEVFAAQVNVGNVDMVVAPWNDIVLQELRSFNGDPKNKDDIVDAGSRAFARLQTPQHMQRMRIF